MSEVNYDEAKAGTYVLPDPLKMEDGRPVTNAAMWKQQRRPEILELFRQHVYGHAPQRPRMTGRQIGPEVSVLSGIGRRRIIDVQLTPGPDPMLATMLLFLPPGKGPFPCYLSMNFWGRHAVTTDTDIPLSTAWFWQKEGSGVVNNRATEQSRGFEAHRYPISCILQRGYALATICYEDIEADHVDGWRTTLRSRMQQLTGYPAEKWAAISAWAWGFSCALDCLEEQPEIDARSVIAQGHSRLGKTALWAGAEDERFAAAISNESGCGGAKLARRNYGESIQFITRTFPHWFVPQYACYAGNENTMPLDHHELIALLAPRPVYVASAQDDRWADPKGEFLAALHAEPVYKLFGKPGLDATEHPPVNTPVGQTIGYHMRTGKHNLTPYDWNQYMNWSDRWITKA